jgi:hypothetical protein
MLSVWELAERALWCLFQGDDLSHSRCITGGGSPRTGRNSTSLRCQIWQRLVSSLIPPIKHTNKLLAARPVPIRPDKYWTLWTGSGQRSANVT